MVRVGTGSRLGPEQVSPARAAPGATERTPAGTSGRALVVIEGSRPEPGRLAVPVERLDAGRIRAGFIAQLLTASDPTLLPSRLERTQMAAARYAEAARRLA